MLSDSVALVVNNLRHRRKRSLLTMIGIFIGIAAVVSLISLGQGMQKAILSQFASVGGDKILVQSVSSGFGPPGYLSVGKITDKDLDAVRLVAGVGEVAGRMLKEATIVFSDQQRIQFVASLPNSDDANLIIEANNYKAAEGRMLKPTDRGKIVIGSGLADKETFGKRIRAGNKLEIKGRNFDVAGVLTPLGDPMRNKAVVMNQDDLRDLFGIKDKELSVIVARALPGTDPEQIALDVQKALRRYRGEKEGKETFKVQTSASLIRTFVTILDIVQAVLVGIACISLLVGGIGITNTMYTAVLERTKEIGVMKAIGATRRQILSVFMIEAGFLGLVGGTIGILMGMTLSKLIEIGSEYAMGSNILQASFPWYLIVGAMCFSFLIGTGSGVMPALRAANLQPVEALRDE